MAVEEGVRPALGRPRSMEDATEGDNGVASCDSTPVGAFRIEGVVPLEEGGLLY